MPRHSKPVALVTGGSRGIGLGIATQLAKQGWDLAINGMRPSDQVAPAVEQIQSSGAQAIYCRGDVSQTADQDSILAAVGQQFGRLDALVNNAGITSPGRLDILDATQESFDRVYEVNLRAVVLLSQRCAQWMVAQRREVPTFRGAIINISSVSAEVISTNRGDYCLARAAVSALAAQWAQQGATVGIDVYEVRPGIIRTDMTAGVTEKYDRLIANGLTADARWGEPVDVARAVTLLLDERRLFAPGTLALVDGGLTRLRSL
jgi:NAD(P)-dependent dehydrogenase (short-subunit alcohol dehydrogenase family)